MKNPESQPRPTIDEIKGDYVDVSIINPEDFRTYLKANTSYTSLYSNTYAKELPQPIYDAQIGYIQNDGDVGIEGELHFRPNMIDQDDVKSWQDTLSIAVDAILIDNGYTSRTLPHEIHTRHIPLNSEYAAYLQFTTETHRCCIEMKLERIHELEHELGEEIGGLSPDNEPDIYKLFKDFATIWASTIDVVVNEYGNQKKKRPFTQIILEAPEKNTSRDTTDQAIQNLIIESFMPEIERKISAEKSFRMLGGLNYQKQQLQSIIDTFNDPVGAKMYGISASHFMLYGPSGTGKTSLVEALTGEINGATLRHIASSDIMASYVGDSGKNLTAIFDEAITHTEPHILFFDEFDAIAGKGNNDSVSHIEVKKLLNQHIVDITKKYPNIIIAAATNLDPRQIEDALIRSGRLKPIASPLPDESERADIWSAVLAQSFANFTDQTTIAIDSATGEIYDNQQFIPYAEDISPPALAQLTEGMTGADFEEILRITRHTCYRHYKQTGEHRRVGQADLLNVIQNFNH